MGTPIEWPDRRLKIIIPVWVLLGISSVFMVWRLAYSLVCRRRFMLCDYLLIVAGVSIPFL